MGKNEIAALKKEIDFLYKVVATVHGLDLQEVLQEIVDLATEITRADSCLIYVIDPKNRELILRASKNPHPELLQEIRMGLGEGITGWVAQSKQPVAISRDASLDPRFKLFRSLPEDSFEAFLSVPIMQKNSIIGVINVQHKNIHDHTEMEINLLCAVGKLVGGVVANARLVEETQALKETLELRKTLDIAKGILMKRRNISEEDAYKMLHRESMNSRKSLKEVADAVILADRLIVDST